MRYPLFILSFGLLLGCTEIFEGEFTSEGSDRIVITGGITNTEVPKVRVYRSVPFGEVGKTPQPIRDANVWIEDDKGQKILMEPKEDIQERDFLFFADPAPMIEDYTTEEAYLRVFWDIDTLVESFKSNFRYEAIDQSTRGEIGRTYTLFVELEDGATYQSAPQTLAASPPISNSYAEYERGRSINELGNEQNEHFWNVFVETPVGQGDDVFLSWRHRGVYEVETFPEEYCDPPSVDCNPGIAHPREVPPSCCKYCYVTEYGAEFNTSTSADIPGNQIQKQIASIPITYDKVYNYYLLEIYQLSVSQEVYDYLDLLNQQITGQGSIFDPTPATIEGNISNSSNGEKALGMFYAAGVTTSQLNLNRSGISAQFTPTRFANDCRLVNNSTDEAPDNYISGKQNQCFNYYNSITGSGWHSCDQCYDFVTSTWSTCPD
ncbi:MAG: DUF4249 family protein [Cyclobacteriaceae bacterium]